MVKITRKDKVKKNISRGRSGMTLLELIIVLALLAGLAGMALTTVGDMGRRGRYDETTVRMRLIREAVVGNGVEPGRFLRDMGRLPYSDSSQEGEELIELWKDAGSLGYGDITLDPVSWPDTPLPSGVPETVTLRGGWNGPYLLVNDPGSAKLFDGFGNAFEITKDAHNLIQSVTSFGADGVAGGSGWAEEDRTLDLAGLIPETSLQVTVKALDTTATPYVWRTVEVISGSEPYQVDALRVGLFYPDISESARTVGEVIEEDQPIINITGLMPVRVRLFAYSTGGELISGDEPEWVDLRPGLNTLTLYLWQP